MIQCSIRDSLSDVCINSDGLMVVVKVCGCCVDEVLAELNTINRIFQF